MRYILEPLHLSSLVPDFVERLRMLFPAFSENILPSSVPPPPPLCLVLHSHPLTARMDLFRCALTLPTESSGRGREEEADVTAVMTKFEVPTALRLPLLALRYLMQAHRAAHATPVPPPHGYLALLETMVFLHTATQWKDNNGSDSLMNIVVRAPAPLSSSAPSATYSVMDVLNLSSAYQHVLKSVTALAQTLHLLEMDGVRTEPPASPHPHHTHLHSQVQEQQLTTESVSGGEEEEEEEEEKKKKEKKKKKPLPFLSSSLSPSQPAAARDIPLPPPSAAPAEQKRPAIAAVSVVDHHHEVPLPFCAPAPHALFDGRLFAYIYSVLSTPTSAMMSQQHATSSTAVKALMRRGCLQFETYADRFRYAETHKETPLSLASINSHPLPTDASGVTAGAAGGDQTRKTEEEEKKEKKKKKEKEKKAKPPRTPLPPTVTVSGQMKKILGKFLRKMAVCHRALQAMGVMTFAPPSPQQLRASPGLSSLSFLLCSLSSLLFSSLLVLSLLVLSLSLLLPSLSPFSFPRSLPSILFSSLPSPSVVLFFPLSLTSI